MQPRKITSRLALHLSLAWPALLFTVVTLQLARADFLDDVDQKLSLSLFGNKLKVKLSGTLDLESYYVDLPPPGLIYSDSHFLFNPRLTVDLDAQLGSQISSFVQTRVDRGFDPSDEGVQVRLDQYAIRVAPWKDVNLYVQAGKFATVVGNWVSRHYSWDNPFINAPLPYENLTGIWDSSAPGSVDTLLYRGHVPYEGVNDFSGEYDDDSSRVPIIWGPNYTSGVSVSGAIGKFDYAAEMKNASLSSEPDSWSLTQVGLDHPTFSGRIGFTPNEMWNLGLSGSVGPYLLPEAANTLPAGEGIGDYREILLGQDASFAWHRFQLWAEVFWTRFEVPDIGNADMFSYYLEAKYKITAQLFAAARWNQQLYGTVRDENENVRWGNDVSRVDAALGYRFSEYLQLKLQYSFTHYEDSNVHEGEQLVAMQLTFKF